MVVKQKVKTSVCGMALIAFTHTENEKPTILVFSSI